MRKILTTVTVSAAALAAMGSAARADFGSDSSWWKSFSITGYAQGGINGNLTGSTAGTNWGQLYTDKANRFELNQASIIFSRPLDPNADDFDYGFTFQPMFGSDARFTHLIGVFDRSSDSTIQGTIIEADFLAHLPWTFGGGTDIKAGIFPSPMSAETTVPYTSTAQNPFYSHSYIFNFGVTVAHTGLFTVTHVDPLLDIYLGFDTGNQTTWFKTGDNNDSQAGFFGAGFNLLGGNLTITWLNHFGPENPTGTLNQQGKLVDGAWRDFTDITAVYKWSNNLTFTTDVNFARDDGFSANAYGLAQYASYALDNTYTLNFRGEVWRDDKGFFVAAFPRASDSLNALEGRANSSISLFPQPATYGEITLGVTIKYPLPEPLGVLLLRPEIRYDTTLNNAKPFDNGRRGDQVTIGADAIISF